MTGARALAIDLDRVLADTTALWEAWLDAAASVLAVDTRALPADRAAAAATLDERAGNWRALLERFCEERVALYVRRDPATSEALRVLAAKREIGVFTDAPEPLARLVLGQLGADRRVSRLEAGTDALERLCAELSSDAIVVADRDELLALAEGQT